MNILNNYNAWIFVKNRSTFYKSVIVLVATLSLIIVLPLFIKVSIDMIALTGAMVLLLITIQRDYKELWGKLKVNSVLYLFCILFISEALIFTGLLHGLALNFQILFSENILLMSIATLWLSSLMSAAINNAPVANILIRVIRNFTIDSNITTLYSAVSMGTLLGENLGPMGDNLNLINNTRDYGYDLEYTDFLRISFVITLIHLVAATIFFFMKSHILLMILGFFILTIISLLINKARELPTILSNLKEELINQIRLLFKLLQTPKELIPYYKKYILISILRIRNLLARESN
jgi:hypothetical protein